MCMDGAHACVGMVHGRFIHTHSVYASIRVPYLAWSRIRIDQTAHLNMHAYDI